MPFHHLFPRVRARSLLLFVVVALCVVTSAAGAQAQTNYPLASTIVVTDGDGNVVSGTTEVSVGQRLTVTANGWLADSDVTLSFICGFGPRVDLGTFRADATGLLRADFVVPDAGSGDCTLRLSGVGSNGNARVVEAPIRVRAAAALAVADANQDADNAQRAAPLAVAGGAQDAAPFARTGIDVRLFMSVGFALLAIGAALWVAVRRQRAAAR